MASTTLASLNVVVTTEVKDFRSGVRDAARESDRFRDSLDRATSSAEKFERSVDTAAKATGKTAKGAEEVSKSTEGASGVVASFAKTLLKTVAAHAVLHFAMKRLRGDAEETTRTFSNIKTQFTTVAQSAKAGVAPAAAKAGRGLKALGVAAAGMLPIMGALAAGLALVAGAIISIKITGLLKDLAKLGSAAAPVSQAFSNLSEHIGTTADALMRRLRAATRGSVSDLELMKASVIALNSEAIKSPDILVELAQSAFVLGRTVGVDTTKAFNNLIRGIGLINPSLLKQLGVLVSAEEAYREFAAEIGVTTAQLSDEQKHHAFLVKVLERVRGARERAIGQMDEQTRNAVRIGIALQQQGTEWDNIRQAMGGAVAASEELSDSFSGVARMLQALTGLVREHRSEITGLVDVVTRMAATVSGVRILSDIFGDIDVPDETMERMKELEREIVAIERALDALQSGARQPIEPPAPPTPPFPNLDRMSERTVPALVDRLSSAADELQRATIEGALLRRTIETGVGPVTDEQKKKWDEIQTAIADARRQVDMLVPVIGRSAEATARELTKSVEAMVPEFRAEMQKILDEAPELEAVVKLKPVMPEAPKIPMADLEKARRAIQPFMETGIAPSELTGKELEKVKAAVQVLREHQQAQQEWANFIRGEVTTLQQDIGRAALAMGESLIRGIISGADNMSDLLKSFMINLAITAIMGPLEGALGIASPSREFFAIGQNLGNSLVLGLRATERSVRDASVGLAAAATSPTMRPAATSPALAGGARLGSAASLSGRVVRFDLSGMPPARNPLESARDGEWQRYLRASARFAAESGAPEFQPAGR